MDGSKASASTAASQTFTRRIPGVVSYRSSALEATAPSLTAAADDSKVQNAPPVREAQRIADRVRQEFKRKNTGARRGGKGGKSGTSASGNDTDKAGRYDRRLKMNRDSAAASRIRREAYVKALEQKLYEEWATKNQLRADLESERAAHSTLRRQYGMVHTTDNSSIMSNTPGGALTSPPSAPGVAPGVVAPDREVTLSHAPNITTTSTENSKSMHGAIHAVDAALTASNSAAPSSPFSVFDAKVTPNETMMGYEDRRVAGVGTNANETGCGSSVAFNDALETFPDSSFIGESTNELEMQPVFNDSDLQSMLPPWMFDANDVVGVSGNETMGDGAPTFT